MATLHGPGHRHKQAVCRRCEDFKRCEPPSGDMTLPVSSYEELLVRVRSLRHETIQLQRELSASSSLLLDHNDNERLDVDVNNGPVSASALAGVSQWAGGGVATLDDVTRGCLNGLRVAADGWPTSASSTLPEYHQQMTTTESLLARLNITPKPVGHCNKEGSMEEPKEEDEKNESKNELEEGETESNARMGVSRTEQPSPTQQDGEDRRSSLLHDGPMSTSEPGCDRDRLTSLYHGTWPVEHSLWHSGPSSLGAGGGGSARGLHAQLNGSQEMSSTVSFTSSNGAGLPSAACSLESERRPCSSQQLGHKVDMVYNLLSMLRHERQDMSRTLLAMSSSPESCAAMRQSGCLPLLVQLLHSPGQSAEVRARAARALRNVVQATPEPDRRGRREARVLRLLEQLREYCEGLRGSQPSPHHDDTDHHPGPAIAALMKLSFDEEHRHAMCHLGGLLAVAELIQMDHEAHGGATSDQACVTLRRFAGMALTNLTFGDGANKALLCSLWPFMRALVAQLASPSEDLRQVTASVLRNLSWRADGASKQALREVGAVPALVRAAMAGTKEATLKSILSALWNLSAHCSMNKVDICEVEGALGFLVDMLSYEAPSKTLAIVENAGGILRNISSHIAVREDYRVKAGAMYKKKLSSVYGDYAETDLDQPTDYSLQYQEEEDEESAAAAHRQLHGSDQDRVSYYSDAAHEDTLKTYCTEGTPYETPYNFSTATSMSDLRCEPPTPQSEKVKEEEVEAPHPASDDANAAEEEVATERPLKPAVEVAAESTPAGFVSPEKPVAYCEEGTPCFSRVSSLSSLASHPAAPDADDHRHLVGASVSVGAAATAQAAVPAGHVMHPQEAVVEEAKEQRDGSCVNKVVTFAGAEETPLMFSRCSSLGSLSSFEQHSIHDDRSSVISDFSRRTSGAVSPSELPDSPTQTVPPSPGPHHSGPASVTGAPARSGHRAGDLVGRLPERTHLLPAARHHGGRSNAPKASVFEDDVAAFKEEDTPVEFSRATSLSSLTIDDEPKISNDTILKEVRTTPRQSPALQVTSEEDGTEKQDREKGTECGELPPVSEGEEEADEDMLNACISVGMPGTGRQRHYDRLSHRSAGHASRSPGRPSGIPLKVGAGPRRHAKVAAAPASQPPPPPQLQNNYVEMRNIRTMIMDELESALAQQAPPPVQEDPSLYELPPLIIDGIPTPVEKMTQAQLRAFIPLMLKYSTGRGKPGWGRESTRPPWWPKELPWANVRMDARTEDEKQKCRNLQISWTHALRQIVINCYKYHGREDLLPAFSEDEEANGTVTAVVSGSSSSNTGSATLVGTAANSTGTATIVGTANRSSVSAATQATVTAQYAPTVLQTISNADGTVSIIQVDPNNPIITLPDGTTAQVQSVTALTEVGPGQGENVAVDLNTVTEATLNQDGQLILTAEDGHGYPVSVSGMITVPVTGSMYQTVVANLQHLHPQGEHGSLQGEDRLFQVVTPMVQVPKAEPGGDASAATEVETITVTPQQLLGPHQLVSVPGEPQLLQVLSLKESPPTPGNATVHTPPHRPTMQLLSLKENSSTSGNAPVQTQPHRPSTPAGKRSAAVGPGESSVVEVSIDVKEEDTAATTSVSGAGGSSSDQ